MSRNKNTIGYRISKIRFELNMNMKQFSEALGVSQPTISRYESCKRSPDFIFLNTLVEKCNASPDFLFGRSEEMFYNSTNEKHVK